MIIYRRYPLIIGQAVLGNKKTDQHSLNLGDGDGERDTRNFKKSRMKSHPTYLPWSHDVFRRVVLGWATGFSFKPQPCHPQLFQIFPFFDPKELHAQIKKTHVNWTLWTTFKNLFKRQMQESPALCLVTPLHLGGDSVPSWKEWRDDLKVGWSMKTPHAWWVSLRKASILIHRILSIRYIYKK